MFFCVISFCEFRLYFDINVIYTNSCVVCQNDPNIDLLYHHQFAMQFASLTERIDIGNPAPLLLHLFNLRAIFFIHLLTMFFFRCSFSYACICNPYFITSNTHKSVHLNQRNYCNLLLTILKWKINKDKN